MPKGKHWVPKHRWSRGRNKSHPGYWRKDRPVGKGIKIEKKATEGLHIRRDSMGHVLGYKFKKKYVPL